MTLIRRFILAAVLMAGFSPAIAQVPAPVPALPDTERRTSYVISGTTCACNVNFALYGDSTDFGNWVEVFINGVRYDYNDASHGWTITTPSGSLGTLARPITNAVLTFNAVQTGTVQIVGARRPRRASQFAENTGVSARNLNQVFTDIISQNREIWDKTNDMTGRGIFAIPGETLRLLPTAGTRASTVLGFDALGNLATYSPASAVTSAASVTFVQNGTGATATTLDALLRTIVVTPEMFGAQCGLGFDSAPAIQRAINYLASITAGTVQFSNCLYTTNSPINVTTNGIKLVGLSDNSGNGTEIYFVPSGAGQCALNLDGGVFPGILTNTAIRNLSIRTPDTTLYKGGICGRSNSVTTLRDVKVYGFNGGAAQTITGAASSGGAGEIRLTVASTASFTTDAAVAVTGVVGTTEANFGWPITVVDATHIDLKGSTFTNAYVSGGTVTMASTALRMQGREFIYLQNVDLQGDLPLRFSSAPSLAGTSGIDVSNFHNLTMIATSTNCNVMVDDGSLIANSSFTGTQSWHGGKSAFCWRTKSSASLTGQIVVDNMRAEQKTASGGWYFDIQSNTLITNFRINNLYSADRNGIRARNVAGLQIDNPTFIDITGTQSCLDIDSTVLNTSITGVYAIAGSGTATLSGQAYKTTGPNPTSGCLPLWAQYASINGANNFGTSFTMAGSSSGTATVQTQAAAGTPTILWPTASGTVVTTATGGCSINATTGALTCSGFAQVAGTGVGDTNYTILSTDRYVYINANFSAARTWTLPAANAVVAGTTIWVQDARNTLTSTNTLTIQRAGADTVNTGGTSIVVNNARGGIALVSDGVSNWGSPVQNVATGGTGLQSGTSGGVPYFSAAALMGSSAALSANAIMLGGGAGNPPITTPTGAGVLTALSNNTGAVGGVDTIIATGTKALATGAIASGACTAAQTSTATGTLTTDVIDTSFNGDPTAVTGYISPNMLTIIPYPTADTVNFKVCNNTPSSITPGAITLNWKVRR